MNASDLINVNYRDLMNKAGELEALADRLDRNYAARIRQMRAELNGCWTGDSAEFYKKKLDKLASITKNRSKELRNAAAALRISAQKYYLLEQIRF